MDNKDFNYCMSLLFNRNAVKMLFIFYRKEPDTKDYWTEQAFKQIC